MIALTDPLAGLNFNGGEERLINTEAIALSRCIAICQLVSFHNLLQWLFITESQMGKGSNVQMLAAKWNILGRSPFDRSLVGHIWVGQTLRQPGTA